MKTNLSRSAIVHEGIEPRHWSPVLLLLTCALLAAAIDVRADNVVAVRRTIQAQYDRMAAALHNRSSAAYLALCAPDFRQKTPNAVIDRAHMYGQLSLMFDAVQNYKQTTQIKSLRVQGKEARVVTIETCAFDMTDSDPAIKHLHHFQQSVYNRDTWVYMNKRWLLKYTDTRISRSQSPNS